MRSPISSFSLSPCPDVGRARRFPRTLVYCFAMLPRCSPYLPLRRYLCNCSGPDMAQYTKSFARRMAMAGMRPHHRIALGISGGPDSMALCVLAAGWKLDGRVAKNETSGFIDGLLGIVVDHRLRAESMQEAILVQDRVNKMGVKCEIENCDWSGGRPKHGHLQEAAREMRYQIFEDVCIKQNIRVLLIAHHADDQAELLILRLSRNSGVLGLAGMAFVSQLFPEPLRCSGSSSCDGILLVRPMLEFTKDDMYNICKGANQEWVEDPTNQKPVFARNRIRSSLRSLPSEPFKSELQRLICSCRLARVYVESTCDKMIKNTVTITEHGYAIIDLEKLKPSNVDDLCLSRYLAWILQFISQRHKPIRGSTSQLLLGYIRNSPCKLDAILVIVETVHFDSRQLLKMYSDKQTETSLTAAGCYLSPAPQSKGTKLLICYSVDSPQSSGTQFPCKHSFVEERPVLHSEVHQIIADAKSYSDQFIPEASGVPIIHARSSTDVLTEARKLDLISGSTLEIISLLQGKEHKNFRSAGLKTGYGSRDEVKCTPAPSLSIHASQSCFFMNRFLVTLKLHRHVEDGYSFGKQDRSCKFCQVDQETTVKVRHMVESDWLFLADLSKSQPTEDGQHQSDIPEHEFTENAEQGVGHSRFIQLSLQRALKMLKSIPIPARKGIPVLVSSDGLLLCIPSIGFSCCPCLSAASIFSPRVPLGGGYSSYI